MPYVVRALSRDSFGKLRRDLDEYFNDWAMARAFFDELLAGNDVDHAEALLIAGYHVDRHGDEYLGPEFRLTGETLREVREMARKKKEQPA